MRILAVLNSEHEFKNGCFFTRIHVPFLELKERGHKMEYGILGKMEEEKALRENDIVVFTRVYQQDPFKFLYKAKARGKKIVYEIDDNVWAIPPVNPAQPIFNQKVVQAMVEGLLEEADLVTTTTEHLKKILSKFNKNVAVCPNAINFNHFRERSKSNERLRIGWSGSITHYDDLLLILDVIIDLQKKYDFDFVVQGICSHPLLSEFYTYGFFRKENWFPQLNEFFDKGLKVAEKFKQIKNFHHIPFYVPELYPKILRELDLDIGLCPLVDNEFNRAKSCIKFYEYCGVGTTTIASNVLPYKEEVNYLANNTYKDWYKKLEKLIIDEKFRENLLNEQRKFVSQNRDIKVVGDLYEKAYQSLLK